MANQGRTTLQFAVANTLYDANDRIVLVYAADTANTSNNIAQTATITVTNFSNSFFQTVPLPTMTFANLPPSPVVGMLLNISDANTVTWGANITIGGNSHNVLARYNGANWTVVGV